MRTLLAALCLCLAACGAESPTSSTGDASTATDGTADAPSDGPVRRCSNEQAFVGGRCVAATARDCAGRRCLSSQNCYVTFGAAGEDDVAECL
jgi:hypothetical protein